MATEDAMNVSLTTNYPEPWALFLTDGHVEGHRPRSALFWIHEAKAVDNRIVAFRVRRKKRDQMANSTRWIDADALVKSWRCFDLSGPDPYSVYLAKGKLISKRQRVEAK